VCRCDNPDIHVDALLTETPARLLCLPMIVSSWIFFQGFSQLATLLGAHLADLLSTDRRRRDGIKTRP
jgi:hypothetical protein